MWPFKSNRQKEKASRGGFPSGEATGDFWGPGSPSSPSIPAAGDEDFDQPKNGKSGQQFLDLLEPLMLYICKQNRDARDGLPIDFEAVYAEIKSRLDKLQARAHRDGLLSQQLEKVRQPLLFYVDWTFGAPDCNFPFNAEWHRNRLGYYGATGNLAGDEKLFDFLDEALSQPASDPAANERLLFYYLCLGLGFRGKFHRQSEEHWSKLRDYMQRLWVRIQDFLDHNASGSLCPEAYKWADQRDLIAIVKQRPLLIVAAMICLIFTLAFGYCWLYDRETKSLHAVLDNISYGKAQSAAASN